MSAPDFVQISKFISRVLRHAPQEVGLTLDEAGWTDVDGLLAACEARGFSVDRPALVRLVAESDKQRFALSPDHHRIRAVQGHSVPVTLGHPVQEPPPRLFHGTVERFLASIQHNGLESKQRHHVHLSADPSTAVAVGERRGSAVVLTIRADAMHQAGHEFMLSPNGVWLTERVPPQFIELPDSSTKDDS